MLLWNNCTDLYIYIGTWASSHGREMRWPGIASERRKDPVVMNASSGRGLSSGVRVYASYLQAKTCRDVGLEGCAMYDVSRLTAIMTNSGPRLVSFHLCSLHPLCSSSPSIPL